MVDSSKWVNKKAFREKFHGKKNVGYDIHELTDYYEALYAAYRSIIAQRPTAIIAPLRGAEPLAKTLMLFASYEHKSSLMPMFYYPKIGQISKGVKSYFVNKVAPDYAASLEADEKKAEISRIVDRIITRAHESKSRQMRILLLDEVIGGGSITTSFGLLSEVLAEKERQISKALGPRAKPTILGGMAISDSTRGKSPFY
ncbi:MAG: hypothetical protein AABW59_03425, partial [archaeon]